jgi:CRISPR-associated protein Csh2
VSTKDDLLNAFIDTRMFGAVYSVTGSNFDVTGPIQIAFSTSLNKVEIFSLQGTVKLPSSSNKGKGTMRWDYVIPYGIFAIYGAVNKNAARLAMLTEDDLVLFYEALYDGVNALHSRSKFGSRSLMLLEVVYKEQKDSLSFLNNLIQLESLVSDETRIRSIKDYRLNFSGVSNRLKLAKDNILRVEVRKIDGDLLPVDKLVIE